MKNLLMMYDLKDLLIFMKCSYVNIEYIMGDEKFVSYTKRTTICYEKFLDTQLHVIIRPDGKCSLNVRNNEYELLDTYYKYERVTEIT